MEISKFMALKEDFKRADTDGKIELYILAENLTPFQYRELLKEFPLNELDKLEKAVSN